LAEDATKAAVLLQVELDSFYKRNERLVHEKIKTSGTRPNTGKIWWGREAVTSREECRHTI